MADEGWRQQRAQELWGDSEPWFIRESRRRTWSPNNDEAPADEPASVDDALKPEERAAPTLKLAPDEVPVAVPERDPQPAPQIVSPPPDTWRATRDHVAADVESRSTVAGSTPAASTDDSWRMQREAPVAPVPHPAVGAVPPIVAAPGAILQPKLRAAPAFRATRLLWLVAAVPAAALSVFVLGRINRDTSTPTLTTTPAVVAEAPQTASPPPPAYVPTLQPTREAPVQAAEGDVAPATHEVARPAVRQGTTSSAKTEIAASAKRTTAKPAQNKAERVAPKGRPALPDLAPPVSHRPEPRTIIIPPEPASIIPPSTEAFPAPSERSRVAADDSAITAQLNTEQAEVARADEPVEPAPRRRRSFWDTSRLPVCTGFQVYRPTTPCRVAPRR